MKGCIVKRLLVVDDEKIFQKMVAFAVQSLDFEIATADDGMAGLEVAQRFLPHVIICDVMMPNLDGYQFIRQLRRNSMFSHVPILVLTSQSELNEKLEAFEAGADDQITQ